MAHTEMVLDRASAEARQVIVAAALSLLLPALALWPAGCAAFGWFFGLF